MTRQTKTMPLLAALLALAALGAAPPALAADKGAFAGLSGTWSGSGQVRFEGGRSERLSCRAYYTPREGGSALSLALRCASKDNKIELRSSLTASGGKVSGSWEERTYNASGSVTGRASGGNISLSIGGGFTGSMQVSTSGSSQSVSISTSGTGFQGVSISLSKS